MASDPFAEGLIAVLHAAGATDEEIARAADRGVAGFVALYADRAIVPGTQRYTRSQVEQLAEISDEDASAFWRALGFPDALDEDAIFTEVDVEMLERVKVLLHGGVIDRDMALQTTRVMGRSVAMIAASLVDTFRSRIGDAVDAPPALIAAAPTMLEDVQRWLVYIWRRHLAAEVKRTAAQLGSDEAGQTVVGFADLVGFTGMSRQLDEAELAAAVSAFEATAVDRVGAHGGRIVKMIGDEVMFEAPSPKDGADIALDLVEAFADDDRLPDVRVGLASGPSIRNQGDLFGAAPNLASRLVDQAYPATILASESIRGSLADDEEYLFRAVPPRSLKGFGRTRFFVLRRASAADEVPVWKVALPRLAALTRLLDEE